jgi:hypothetical protein
MVEFLTFTGALVYLVLLAGLIYALAPKSKKDPKLDLVKVQKRFLNNLSGSSWLIHTGGPGNRSNHFGWTFGSDREGLNVEELRGEVSRFCSTKFLWRQLSPGVIEILNTHSYPGDQALDYGGESYFEWLVPEETPAKWEKIIYDVEIREDLLWITGLPHTPDLLCDWHEDRYSVIDKRD